MAASVSSPQNSPTPMRLVVTGASGRMGKALIRAIADNPATVLSGAIVREGSPLIGQDAGEMAGAGKNGVLLSADPLPVFAEAEGVLDFTTPATTLIYAALAAQARIVHVIGTTGCSEEDEEKIRAAARHATIIKSGNMSLGVNLLSALVEQAARALPPSAFDIEILEMHHKHKVDAPSGTALLLGEAAAEGRNINLSDHSVRVRDGHTGAREDGTIGFATLRGGSVIGEHSVMFAGVSERITLTHQAQDRSVFAEGAVAAGLWARGKKPGLYSMRDVLGL
ncbi:MAG: 4-hydroxy-tetrahydrodipicolinate reductase [Brucellaceae bacterium]|nr:4-hydroxy-tetrahydrodipicolinate reductase [Brucellaceae bacterium]